ncbi:hypothetical protein AVEN_184684-1 [Araneus ventricosus]|uniref:Uncharacterized protein n=1 Tax=Araneus ventricosus TaxID=182803 RepID=A0A4Y2FTJ2_ARAVE|nr:hypothetical protein AVEN_184684-1 [Araneus ventricosus]
MERRKSTSKRRVKGLENSSSCLCIFIGIPPKNPVEVLYNSATNMESRFPAMLFLWLGREFYRETDRKMSKMSRVPGRPPTSTTPDNIERVRRMLADDRRLSLRMMAEELKISLDSVSNIIYEHLQKRKKKVFAFPTLRGSSNV